VVEATIVFAAQYPPAPAPSFSIANEPPSRWEPSRLYSDGMFHGPSFQGTVSMDRASGAGAAATMTVPDRSTLIAGVPAPAFLLDPVALDNAGQVVAFWSQEVLDRDGDIFPFRLEALDCYSPPLAAGTRFECRVRPTHVTEGEIHSDIELVHSGRVQYRLSSWEDRRFRLPQVLRELRLRPREAFASVSWPEPVRHLLEAENFACRRLDALTPEFLESSHGIWLKMLGYCVLSRKERQSWESIRSIPRRKIEWILGRCAAKDAIRELMARRFGLKLAAADVEIEPDAQGRPTVRGAWIERLGVHPVVSISHSNGCAAALAALSPEHLVGIDVEFHTRRPDSFASTAFTKDELQLLSSLEGDHRDEWPLRLWCAKESVSKGFGHGLAEAVASIGIQQLDSSSGRVDVFLKGALLDRFPRFRGKTISAYTRRDQDYVSSSFVCRIEAPL
jgi:phosphopantetheinyl transferase